jgi:molybdopterin converting factor small subunit
MAQVAVMYRGGLAEITKIRNEQFDAATVSEVLRHIKSQYGKAAFQAAKPMLIIVNGVSILQKQVYKTVLCDGDVVAFLPLAAGG